MGNSRLVLALAALLLVPLLLAAAGGQKRRHPRPPPAPSATAGAPAPTGAPAPSAAAALPEGETGLAARYPGDAGIAQDPAVLFADDFEGYADASGLAANWNAGIYHRVRLAAEAGSFYSGRQGLEFTLPRQEEELSNGVARRLAPEQDLLFLRYYTKFSALFGVVGSCHNGAGMSAHYFRDGQATPGVPADGRNKFLVEFECWRGEEQEPAPGRWNVYVYHPEQRSQWGDHFFPDGTVMPNTSLRFDFGPGFAARPIVVPELDRWYCCELMVKANAPGARDGRIACWLDGALLADFPNLRLRDVETLKLDRFNLSLHAGSNPGGPVRKYYDDVVAARAYIGPRAAPRPADSPQR